MATSSLPASAEAEPERAQRASSGAAAAAGERSPGPAASERSSEKWAYDLSDEIMSPFCPGRTLAECPSSQASDLRFWIIDQARGGATREEVEAELFSIYGDQLLQSPRPEGIGLVAYVVPVLFLLGGAALVVLFLARQRRAAVPEPPPAPALVDPELERRLDEDLARGHEA